LQHSRLVLARVCLSVGAQQTLVQPHTCVLPVPGVNAR
jgi:hypothetical protein